MNFENGKRNLIAVLIDCDNASPRHAEIIFAEIAKLGEGIVRRGYGDFTSPGLKGWSEIIPEYAIVPVQTAAMKGKNSTDIFMAIDAMDLSYSGIYDSFCIISSDSDFARLAQRLRERGHEVYCFGQAKTPRSLRQSCRRFFLIENLARQQSGTRVLAELDLPSEGVRLTPDRSIPILLQAYDSLEGEHADGWVPIRQLQKTIANIEPDFDPRTYGETRVGDLAKKTGRFEIRQIRDKGWRIKKIPSRKPARRQHSVKTVKQIKG